MDEADPTAAASGREPLVKRLRTMEDKLGASMRGLTVQEGLVSRVEALSKEVSVNLGHISRQTKELQRLDATQRACDEHLSQVEVHVGELGSKESVLEGQMGIA